MTRILKRLLLTLAALVVVAVAATFLLLRASLPPLDGDRRVSGVAADVVIERDDAGIPTITATTRTDLAFGTGFAHAQDRFFQMDLTRRKSAGELAALVGAAALPLDRSSRLHRFRARASEAIRRLSNAERVLLDAYVDGVNAGLASLSARPFEYIVLRAAPAPWTPEDTLLVVYAMFMELNDERAARDVQRGFARRSLPAEVFDWLYPAGTSWDAPLRGETTPPIAMPTADIIDLRELSAAATGRIIDTEGTLPGSNNWAVAGTLTATGRAIVANDMHLGITTPNVFYRARLVQSGAAARDVSGVTLPGAPVIVAGSNGMIAWGFTNSYGDWSDAVLLVPGEQPNTYKTAAGDRPVTTYSEQIDVKGGPGETLLVRETDWGPILDDVNYPDGEIAVSWVAHAAAGVNIVQLELETAAAVDDAIAIANRVAIPPQNFVVGDADGNIAWTIAGRIPQRGSSEPLLPADWSRGDGWQGWLAAEDYPRWLIRSPGASGRPTRGLLMARTSGKLAMVATTWAPARGRFATTCLPVNTSSRQTC